MLWVSQATTSFAFCVLLQRSRLDYGVDPSTVICAMAKANLTNIESVFFSTNSLRCI